MVASLLLQPAMVLPENPNNNHELTNENHRSIERYSQIIATCSDLTIRTRTNEFSVVKSCGGSPSYLSIMAAILKFNLTGAPGTMGGN